MGKKTSLSLAVSQEELLVILAYMNVKQLVGFDYEVSEKATDDQLKLIMEICERTLYARGFLVRNHDGILTLSPAPHALIRTCTNPEQSLIINSSFADKPDEKYYFHTARKMAVVHTVPITAIHQFIAVENRQALVKSAWSILDTKFVPMLTCEGGFISDDVLKEARQVGLTGDENGAKELLMTVFDDESAIDLARTLANPMSSHSIVSVHHLQNGESKVDGFVLFIGVNGLWLVEPKEEQDNIALIKPVSTETIGQLLKKLIV